MFSFFKKKLNEGYSALKNIFGIKNLKLSNEKNEIINFLLESGFKKELISKIIDNVPENKVDKIFFIKQNLKKIINENENNENNSKKEVILIVGINGSGKTTSLIKLARFFKSENKNTLIVPCDTFRAAAYEQLKFLAIRENCDFFEDEKINEKKKSDPASIVYKAISEKSNFFDKIIIDTAGRIHQDESLLRELKKIHKIAKERSEKENLNLKTLIVLDSLQGNSLEKQFKEFSEIIKIDGIILTKLDSGSKPGNIISIIDIYKVPLLYLTYGEYKTDIVPFETDLFLDLLLGANNDINKE